MTITLASGRQVRLDSYHRSETYGGIYEGLPRVAEMLDRARQSLERIWGTGRPILVLPPQLTPGRPIPEGSPSRRYYGSDHYPERLPPICHLAWLESSELEDGQGSHLFVIFWTEDDQSGSLSSLLSEMLRDVDWEAHAKDFWD